METAYGDPSAVPSGDDLLAYLTWCKEQRAQLAARRRPLGSVRRRSGGAR